MHNLGPSLRPYQKVFACFLLTGLFLTGTIMGLYLKMAVSPTKTAAIYYAQAKQYSDQIDTVELQSSLAKLYRDQAAYYLTQVSLYAPLYDPQNIRHKINNLYDQSIVHMTSTALPQRISVAYRDDIQSQ